MILGIGLWGTALVRPHIAVLVFGAAAVAYLLRGHGPKHVNAGLGKLVGVVALVCIGMVMAGSLKDQFNLDQLDGAAVEQIFDKTITQTSTGNSGYDAVNAIKNPLRFPLAVVAVLFRPFPFEAGNGPPMATAIEGVFLMVLFALSWRRVFGAIRLLRKAPFVAFAATYSLLFVIAFSSIGNFGILARQRCQLLPFLIVLLAAPTPMRTRAGAGASRAIRAGKRMKSGRPSTTDGPAWTSGGKPVSNTVRRDAQ